MFGSTLSSVTPFSGILSAEGSSPISTSTGGEGLLSDGKTGGLIDLSGERDLGVTVSLATSQLPGMGNIGLGIGIGFTLGSSSRFNMASTFRAANLEKPLCQCIDLRISIYIILFYIVIKNQLYIKQICKTDLFLVT